MSISSRYCLILSLLLYGFPLLGSDDFDSEESKHEIEENIELQLEPEALEEQENVNEEWELPSSEEQESKLAFIIRDRRAFEKSTDNDRSPYPNLFITEGDDLENENSISFKEFINSILDRPETHIVFHFHGYTIVPSKAKRHARSIQWIAESDFFSKKDEDGTKQRDVLVIPIMWGTKGGKFLDYGTDTLYRAKDSTPVLAGLIRALSDYRDANKLKFQKSEEDLSVNHDSSLMKSLMISSSKKFHIIAHSMGNRALKHTIRNMNSVRPGEGGVFSSIHSVAADISMRKIERLDGELFVESLTKEAKEQGNVFVYYSKEDFALASSSVLRFVPLPHIKDRLGRNAERLDIIGVNTIDCTKISKKIDKLKKHSYILRSDKVIKKDPSIAHRHTETLQAILRFILDGIKPEDPLSFQNLDSYPGFLMTKY